MDEMHRGASAAQSRALATDAGTALSETGPSESSLRSLSDPGLFGSELDALLTCLLVLSGRLFAHRVGFELPHACLFSHCFMC